LDAIKRMEIERACERLVNVYANRIDAYDYEGFLKLWAEDAVWNVLGKEWRGHAGIRRGLEARDQTMICRHLVSNIVIDVADENRASGVCYTIAYRVLNARGKAPALFEPPQFLVDYRDSFVRDSRRGWLFARRDVSSAMQRELD
jgi:ketosteroid isomerase-like protein